MLSVLVLVELVQEVHCTCPAVSVIYLREKSKGESWWLLLFMYVSGSKVTFQSNPPWGTMGTCSAINKSAFSFVWVPPMAGKLRAWQVGIGFQVSPVPITTSLWSYWAIPLQWGTSLLQYPFYPSTAPLARKYFLYSRYLPPSICHPLVLFLFCGIRKHKYNSSSVWYYFRHLKITNMFSPAMCLFSENRGFSMDYTLSMARIPVTPESLRLSFSASIGSAAHFHGYTFDSIPTSPLTSYKSRFPPLEVK